MEDKKITLSCNKSHERNEQLDNAYALRNGVNIEFQVIKMPKISQIMQFSNFWVNIKRNNSTT